ncbi:KTSC domain-containing protein [Mesorhizobium sp. M0322]|uniref:KTSC domain-containing protein n=1 Tax=Mesorhizobium sp. M0322 TaxID=2956937 RepID=UPI00333CCBF2
MERQSVTSGNLAEVGYDPDLETLEVQFRHGGVYQYYNVPLYMNERLMTAESLGRFFNTEIKGHYPEAKM